MTGSGVEFREPGETQERVPDIIANVLWKVKCRRANVELQLWADLF